MRFERGVLALSSAHHHPGRRDVRGRVLCYHSTGTPSWGVNDVSPSDFRRHIELSLELGYRFVPAEVIAGGRGEPSDLAITFDDGLTSVAVHAAPILRDYAIPWTLFVVSAWADGTHTFGADVVLGWREIVALARQGVTIASHSVTHPNFRGLSAAEAEYELFESRRVIEARTGIATRAFAIPFGQSTDWTTLAATAARRAGYEAVYAQSEQRRPRGTIPRTFITRFDHDRIFRAALRGAFDMWEEWA
jgi:peptidoglycan/xylan/chitin deacetylase (PgdA/CDA1 family)